MDLHDKWAYKRRLSNEYKHNKQMKVIIKPVTSKVIQEHDKL